MGKPLGANQVSGASRSKAQLVVTELLRHLISLWSLGSLHLRARKS